MPLCGLWAKIRNDSERRTMKDLKHILGLKTLIGIELFYNVVLVSVVQQTESAVRIHTSLLFQISFPFSSLQSTAQSSLRCAAGSHQLPTLYTGSTVNICQSPSPSSSHPPLHPLRATYFFSLEYH